MALVLVETAVTYRMRYVVEVRGDEYIDEALPVVLEGRAQEFSQHYQGEQIMSTQLITEEDALALYDKDNSGFKSWDVETKKKNAFTLLSK